jgi:hypothetical protein
VTFSNGEGAFSRQRKKVVFTVATLAEPAKLKQRILTRDPNAFIVINDALEVYGNRMGRMPEFYFDKVLMRGKYYEASNHDATIERLSAIGF